MKPKFLFSISIFLLLTSICTAQISQGTFFFGGTASLSNTFRKGDDVFSFSLRPGAGFMITNKLGLGSDLLLDYNSVGDFNSTSYGVVPFLRYYFDTSNEKTKPFVFGNIGVIGVSNDGFSDSGYKIGVGGGLDFFLTQALAIEGIMEYSSQKIGDEDAVSNLLFAFGLRAFINL